MARQTLLPRPTWSSKNTLCASPSTTKKKNKNKKIKKGSGIDDQKKVENPLFVKRPQEKVRLLSQRLDRQRGEEHRARRADWDGPSLEAPCGGRRAREKLISELGYDKAI
jgi:hypothetical protein